MSSSTSPHNLSPTPDGQVQLLSVPHTPTQRSPPDPNPGVSATTATPQNFRYPVEAVAKPYRIMEFNAQMEDHYSSVTPAEFMLLFFDPKQEDHKPISLRLTAQKLKHVPKAETQSCYEMFCDIFNEALGNAKLKYVMKNTSMSRQKRDDSKAAPDLCLYSTDDYAKKAYTIDSEADDDSNASEATVLKNKALTAWAWIVLFFEIKMDSRWEPFTDGEDGKLLLRGTESGAEARAQNIGYAMRIQRYQHRRFLFSVSIQGTKARFLRWDRNGVVVSHEFDYIQDPEKLLEFVYYVAAATPSLQGYDDSVRRLGLDEAKALEKVVAAEYKPTCGLDSAANASLREASREIFADLLLHPVYELSCSGLEPDTSRRFYIGKYRASSWSPVGRGTRVYVAYDPKANDIAMLKDSWCVIGLAGVLNEFEVLNEFLRAGIKHVPTIVAGGFVDGATTVSQVFIERDTGNHHTIRQNLRFAVKEVGRSIDTFKTSRELVQVIYSAFKGHRSAYEMENGVLHRDISYANILIDVATGAGFMNDWDMCKRVAALGRGPTQHSRSGTWHYMAAILKRYPRMYNVLPHDLESFVYALVVPVLQFQDHDLNTELASYFSTTFEDAIKTAGLVHGGGRKTEHIRAGHPGWELSADESPLANLISDLYRLLQSQWSSFSKLETRAMLAHWGVPNPKNPDPKDHPIPELVASRPMATHDAMDKIFEDALAADGWDDERLKKTDDQFIGLFVNRPVLPHLVNTSGLWLTAHKRARGTDDKVDDPFAKRTKPTTSQRPSFTIPSTLPSTSSSLGAENKAGNVSHTDHDTDEEWEDTVNKILSEARDLGGKGVGARR